VNLCEARGKGEEGRPGYFTSEEEAAPGKRKRYRNKGEIWRGRSRGEGKERERERERERGEKDAKDR